MAVMNAVQRAGVARPARGFLFEPPASRHIEGQGTPDAEWQAWGGLARLPVVNAAALAPPGGRAIIVAPHPDDEVLACGGLLQLLHAQGTRTVLLAVTDGDASHPGSTLLPPATLARLRPQETLAAMRALGLEPLDEARRPSIGAVQATAGTADPSAASPSATAAAAAAAAAPQVLRARIGDGRVSAEIDQLQNLLHQLLRPEDTVFVTWRQDGHPDHEACGLAAAMATQACGATLIEMPVWSWHWATPGDNRLPWQRARRLELSPDVMQRKRQAVACFVSQLQADPSTGNQPILPPHVLARLLHPYEIYFT